MTKLGEIMEAGDWFSNPSEEAQAKSGIRAALQRAEECHGIILGPVKWQTLKPGDERAPEPPKDMLEPRLLIGEAKVQARLAPDNDSFRGGWARFLGFAELQRLRQITRQAYSAQWPTEAPLNDAQCDAVIEVLGPRAVQTEIQQAIKARVLH